jgi:hypothetical protein
MLMRDDSTVFHHVPQRSEARRVKKSLLPAESAVMDDIHD